MALESRWKRESLRNYTDKVRNYDDNYNRDNTNISYSDSPLSKVLIGSLIAGASIGAYKSGLLKNAIKGVLEYADEKAFTNTAKLSTFKDWISSNHEVPVNSLIRKKLNFNQLLKDENYRESVFEDTKEDWRYLLDELKKGTNKAEEFQSNKAARNYNHTELRYDIGRFNETINGITNNTTFNTQDLKDKLVNGFYEANAISKNIRNNQIKKRGYKTLTLGDILTIDKNGKLIPKDIDFRLDEDTFNSFDKIANMNTTIDGKVTNLIKSNKYKDIALDPNIMIDENNKIIDLREANNSFKFFIKSLKNDFQIPILGINPLGLFDVDKLFRKKLNYAVLWADTVQNSIINEAGRKTVKETISKNPLVQIGSNTFKFNNDSSLTKIAENKRLLDVTESVLNDHTLQREINSFRKIFDLGFHEVTEAEEFTKEDGLFKYYYGKTMKTMGLGRQDAEARFPTSLIDPSTYVNFFIKDLTNPENNSKFAKFTRNVVEKLRPYRSATKHDLIQVFGKTPANEHLFIAVNKAEKLNLNGQTFNEAINSIKSYSINLGKSLIGGRSNLKNVNYSTTIPYFLLERINSTLNSFSLALPNSDLGSAGSTLKNLLLKRFLPIYLGYNLIVDVGNLTEYKDKEGKKHNIYSGISNASEFMSIGFNKIRDSLYITPLSKKLRELMPGAEQITEIPGFGWLDMTKTAEERRQFYDKGMVPIRKGRYWALGNTSFTGGKTEYYLPNIHRRIESDYKYTSTLYGSRDEYLANSPVPSLSHPLSPLRAFIFDKYHYERKHHNDRPYLETTPAFATVPIVGPLLSSTVGKIFKPVKKMHKKYWKDSNNAAMIVGSGMNNAIAYPYNFNIVNPNKSQTIGALKPEDIADFDIEDSEIYETSSGSTKLVDIGNNNIGSVKHDLKKESIKKVSGTLVLNLHKKEKAKANIENPISMSNVFEDQFKLATDVTGIYGFGLSGFFTGEAGAHTTRVEQSGYAYSLNRNFWDSNLGGYGGDLSEIFRRFVPRRRKDIDWYNPIRNTMPSWVPGCFIKDTKVLTEKGFKNIQDVVTKDKVYSHTGNIQEVEYVNKALYNGDFVKITAVGLATDIISTGNHPFYVTKSNYCPYFKEKKRTCIPNVHPSNKKPCKYCKQVQYNNPEWEEARNLKEQDFLMIPIPKKEITINSIKIPSINKRLVKNLTDKEFELNFDNGVFCGFYLSEGSVSKGIVAFGSGENEKGQRDTVDKLCNQYNLNVKHIPHYDINGKGDILTQIYSTHLKEFLVINFGEGAFNKKLPTWIYNAPVDFQMGLVAGYIEGDGYVNARKGVSASSVSHLLLHQLMLLLAQNNIISNLALKTNSTKSNKLSDNVQYVLNVSQLHSVELKKLCNNYGRKISQIPNNKPKCTGSSSVIYNGYILRKITNLEVFYDKTNVYNLQVSNEHTFNVQGVGVHNSNYFTDYQHGDPFSKIPRGEIRLPSEAYEKIWGIENPLALRIGSSFIGKGTPDIIKHFLKQDTITDSDLIEVVDKGNRIHKKLENEWIRQGIALDVEGQINDPVHRIIGFYDARIIDESSPTHEAIVDIKSVNPKKFKSLRKAVEENKRQLNYYLYATNNPKGYLYYVNSEDPTKIKRYTVNYSKRLLKQTLKDLDNARKYILNGISNNTISRGDLYDYMDRFRILSDIAPYSNEFKEVNAVISKMKLTKEQELEVQQIRKQTQDVKNPLRIYPYKFKNIGLDYKTVHVTKVIDANTFLTEEFKDNPIKLAGVHVSNDKNDKTAIENRKKVGKYIHKGATLKIGIDEDPLSRVKNDKLHTMRAVVYKDLRNVNRYIIKNNLGKEDTDDFSPAGVHSRFSSGAISFGAVWETIAHSNNIINNKFLQVRSGIEDYERRNLYNKDFKSWTSPYRDWLKPMFNSMVNNKFGLVEGAMIGWMFGIGTPISFYKNRHSRYGKVIGAAIGFSTVGLGKLYKHYYETTNHSKWIPKERRQERELNEYSDILKYLKYKRLYEQYAHKALKENKIDVKKFLENENKKGDIRKARVEKLNDIKKYLEENGLNHHAKQLIKDANLRYMPKDLKEVEHAINKEINDDRNYRTIKTLPKNALLAIKYHNLAEQTMYAYDKGDPIENILTAIPKKERQYMKYFLKARGKERMRILEETPRYVRRPLESVWGLPVEDKPDLIKYFQKHQLPGPKWRGWQENVDIDAVKVKLIKHEALSYSEFNLWDNDIKLANAQGNIPVPKIHHREDSVTVRNKLYDILHGSGMTDIKIEAYGRSKDTTLDLDLKKDKRDELEEYIKKYEI